MQDGAEMEASNRIVSMVNALLLAPGGKGYSEPERKGQYQPDEKGQTRLSLVCFNSQDPASQVRFPA